MTHARTLRLVRTQRFRWNSRTMVPDAERFTFAPSANQAAEAWARQAYDKGLYQLGIGSQVQDGEFRLTTSGPDFPRFDWITFAEPVA